MPSTLGTPASSDAGSILVWVLGLIGLAVTSGGTLFTLWLRGVQTDRAKERELDIERRKREEAEDAQTRARERAAIEAMIETTRALPRVLESAIKGVEIAINAGFAAMGKQMVEHERVMSETVNRDMSVLVTQLHRELVGSPKSTRASDPGVIEESPARPQRRLGSRPQ